MLLQIFDSLSIGSMWSVYASQLGWSCWNMSLVTVTAVIAENTEQEQMSDNLLRLLPIINSLFIASSQSATGTEW